MDHESAIVVDGVWKKFRRGERHDSLRDLIPAVAKRFARRGQTSDLGDQEFWAIRDLSFDVKRGQALGIIGPNGAGKSTILKLLNRILKPTRGACVVRGRVGALIEVAAGFHPDLTGRENIYLQGAIMGMRRTEIASRLDEIIDFAGIAEFIDTPVKRYSNGMNARLGFSIAAHLDPDVLIIDEVLSVGDAAFHERCANRMQAYLDNGTTIVFVSHNLGAIAQLCKRVVLLARGQASVVGLADPVIAQYCRAMSSAPAAAGEDVSIRVETPGRRDDEAAWFVTPGQRVALDVAVTFERPVSGATIGIVVWDLARNLYVYGVTSDAVGLPLLSGRAGQSARFAFEFAANLARGTYAIEVNVMYPERHVRLGILKPAAQFTVVEHVTHAGIANLFLGERSVQTPKVA